MTTPAPAAPPPPPLPQTILRDMNSSQHTVLRASAQSLADLKKGR